MSQTTPFAAAFAQANLPGAVGLIVDRDGIRHAEALGLADVSSGAAMELDTLCQIASMTKALVSAGAMQLVEQGRLDLDADIGALLPELANPQVLIGIGPDKQPQLRPAKRAITLRHLLTHTAGLGYFFIHPEVLQYYGAVGMPKPGSRASVTMPLMFDPGERWEYSVATDWVGLAIEAATGERLNDYLTANLFAPLGMTSTAFRDKLPDGAARETNPAVSMRPTICVMVGKVTPSFRARSLTRMAWATNNALMTALWATVTGADLISRRMATLTRISRGRSSSAMSRHLFGFSGSVKVDQRGCSE